MKKSAILNMGVVLIATTALSGCLGSDSNGGGATAASGGGGGSSGGGTVTFANYQSEFDRVSMTIPTSDMPTTLKGNYVGAMQAQVGDASGNIAGSLVADVNLAIDWTEGATPNPFSGGASNFRGTTDGGTTVEAISGSLSVDPNLPSAIIRNSNTLNTVAGQVTVDAGSMTVPLAGDLTLNGQTAEANVLLGGGFFGSGGTAAAGTAVGGFRAAGTAPLSGIFDGSISGTYYVERQ
ncbi:hypothetical protein [Aestuariivita sp.]|uniref:hypothetical protein n=1 Tax=Aestuariivita sp. TaxID=1872407 RepID=UPI00217071F4|nr:hypothetical protein [Aestuariivita sp.]MCE8006343.1 hypothetical protein [Aestuariivita sp.]